MKLVPDSFPRPARAALAALLLCLFCVPAFSAGPAPVETAPGPGLLGNRTGLPAVFPLQVKSPGGQDYLLTLRDAETGTGALAAYVRGGQFFRVLVPPGTFQLHFSAGNGWQSDAAQFGTETLAFDLPQPLTFRTFGHSIKAGYIITFEDAPAGALARITLRSQFICQSLSSEYPRTTAIPRDEPWNREVRDLSWQFRPGPDGTGAVLADPDDGLLPRAYQVHPPVPQNMVRSRYCG